jgi:hypothetical protein
LSLKLFNTLTGNIEPLFASDGKVLRFYCCGPTVYDYGHIGNFRTFLHVDVLRRVIKLHGIDVHHVMNITDVDDKIIRNAAAASKSIGEFSQKFETAFFEDMASLGIEMPEDVARATENIGLPSRTLRTKPRTEAGTSASPASRPTASSPARTLRASKTVRASISTSMTRTLPATSLYGRPPRPRMNRAKPPGIRPSATDGRGGTSSARRWR